MDNHHILDVIFDAESNGLFHFRIRLLNPIFIKTRGPAKVYGQNSTIDVFDMVQYFIALTIESNRRPLDLSLDMSNSKKFIKVRKLLSFKVVPATFLARK